MNGKRARQRWQRCPSRQGFAFALVELLVVIAVVAILAALLLPALSRAHEKSQVTVCKSNLRQVLLGMQVYVSDFGAYAPYYHQTTDPADSIYWFDRIKPYVRASWPALNYTGLLRQPPSSVFTCPGYDRMPGVYSTGPTPVGQDFFPLGAYAYNAVGVGLQEGMPGGGDFHLGLGGDFFSDVTRDSQVLKPSEMIGLGDSPLAQEQPGWAGFPVSLSEGIDKFDLGLHDRALWAPWPGESGSLVARRMQYSRRHSGRFNMIFCDGHVEYKRAESFFAPQSDYVLRRFNNDNKPHRVALGPP
jgi:prepilin-type processing-associated H-X9-DG protein